MKRRSPRTHIARGKTGVYCGAQKSWPSAVITSVKWAQSKRVDCARCLRLVDRHAEADAIVRQRSGSRRVKDPEALFARRINEQRAST